MKHTQKEEIAERIINLLSRSGGRVSTYEADVLREYGEILPLLSDGSTRRFFRVHLKGKNICLAVAPDSREEKYLAEARSALLIGNHLLRTGVPVPDILGWDENSGLILFEDLGDIRFHDLKGTVNFKDLVTWYRQAIDKLVHMQLKGTEGFNTDWCWDTPRYDRELMITRESHYFLKAFWLDSLGFTAPDGIEEEFGQIASFIDGMLPDVFLHRDFQSRNIMIKDGQVRFIDYQAGRLGPPGYDLASLLIDPYAALPPDVQEDLLEYYLGKPEIQKAFSQKDLRKQYQFLALQRNLQIIGAFSFLSRERKKPFFIQYISPSLVLLGKRLHEPIFADFPLLSKMAETALDYYTR